MENPDKQVPSDQAQQPDQAQLAEETELNSQVESSKGQAQQSNEPVSDEQLSSEQAQPSDDQAKVTKEPEAQETSTAAKLKRNESKLKRKKSHFFADVSVTVGIALVLFILIRLFVIQVFEIPSGSMESTLKIGDRVLINKLVPRVLKVNRGDIVVFHDPDNWLNGASEKPTGFNSFLVDIGISINGAGDNEFLIKRVIAVGGDTVSCDGKGRPLKINGTPIDEPYVKSGSSPSDIKFTKTVPDGFVWVMGDNRSNSADSRYHINDSNGGAVPLKDIVGVAVAKTWPLKNFEIFHNPKNTFSQVK